MNLNCKLIEKSFKDDSGTTRKYYVLEFNLIDGSTLEVSLKSDKAKLLTLSNNYNNNATMPDDDWLKN